MVMGLAKEPLGKGESASVRYFKAEIHLLPRAGTSPTYSSSNHFERDI